MVRVLEELMAAAGVVNEETATLQGPDQARRAKGTSIVVDEAPSWNDLYAKHEVARIDHQHAYSLNGVYSNGAESFLSRMRRAEIGHHHHVGGPYLVRYAQASGWREDKRRVSNGDEVQMAVSLALASRPSPDFCGYWQRHKAASQRHYRPEVVRLLAITGVNQ